MCKGRVVRVLPHVGSFGPASPEEILRPARPWFVLLSLLIGLLANLAPVSGVAIISGTTAGWPTSTLP